MWHQDPICRKPYSHSIFIDYLSACLLLTHNQFPSCCLRIISLATWASYNLRVIGVWHPFSYRGCDQVKQWQLDNCLVPSTWSEPFFSKNNKIDGDKSYLLNEAKVSRALFFIGAGNIISLTVNLLTSRRDAGMFPEYDGTLLTSP